MKHLRFVNRSFSLVVAAACLFVSGCQDDEIRSYKAPKPAEDGKKFEVPNFAQNAKGGEAPKDFGRPATRILGAAFPNEGGGNWYVKLLGPVEIIDKNEAAFDAFLASVKWKGNKPEFTMPEGWKQGKGNQFSVIALALPGDGPPVELTVSSVAGSLLDNLNRWRGQVGLEAMQQGDLGTNSKEITIDGKKGIRIDWKSAKASTPVVPEKKNELPIDSGKPNTRILGAAIPAEGGHWYVKLLGPAEIIDKNEAAFDAFLASIKWKNNGDLPLEFTVPEGWKKGRGTQFSFVALALPGEGAPELTVSAVGGSLLENLNRWRGQVSLEAMAPAEMATMTKELTIDGKKGIRVDWKGMAGAKGMPPFMKGR